MRVIPFLMVVLLVSCGRSAMMATGGTSAIDAPAFDRARIVFYRPSDCDGPRFVAVGHATWGVLGELKRGSYFKQDAPAGQHLFWTFSERPGDGAAVAASLEPGKLALVEVCPSRLASARMRAAYPYSDHWNGLTGVLRNAMQLVPTGKSGAEAFSRQHPGYDPRLMHDWALRALAAYPLESKPEHILGPEHGQARLVPVMRADTARVTDLAPEPFVATIVFVRPAPNGTRRAIDIADAEGNYVAGVKRGTQAVARVRPGPHMFWAASANAALRAELIAGRFYFIHVDVNDRDEVQLRAMKPGAPNWALIGNWLRASEVSPLEWEGGRERMLEREREGRRAALADALFRSYTAAAAAERTLAPQDGQAQAPAAGSQLPNVVPASHAQDQQTNSAVGTTAPPAAPSTKIVVVTVPEQPPRLKVVGTGTCFAVSPEGDIVTAYHVVAGAAVLGVKFGDNDPVPANLVRSSDATDVALLKADAKTPHYLPLVSSTRARVGQKVFTVGYPRPDTMGLEPKYTEGSISAMSGPGDDRSFMQIQVPLQAGNSGGPIVTMKGEVIGIVWSKHRGTELVNYATKSDNALLLLSRDVPRKSSTGDVVAAVRKATCLLVDMRWEK
jgi:S1-C subfamily serine protease